MATLSSSSAQLSLLTFLFLLLLIHRRLSDNTTYVLRITRLIFKSHQLDGFLSPALGRLAELKEISLAHNNLIDKIPSQIVDCRKLEILNLGDNRFSRKVPVRLSNLIRLRTLDLSSNKLSGNLSFIKHFPNLESLSIADNFFSGKIPASFRSFRNLRLFNFAGNEFLDGSLPTMKIIEISATNVPKRYILAENTSTKGHNNTTVTANAQAPTNALTLGPSATPKQKKNNKKLLLAVVKGVGKDGGPAIFGWRGGGDVYKAKFPGSNSKIIAIKKIVQPHKDIDELIAEEETHMSQPNCHYLVYEFMKNRSLKDMLNQVANETRQLDWLTRHNIALGVAARLEYLHIDNTPQIIHGALSPANILLDGNMEARIADSRHAKAMPNENLKQVIDVKLMGNKYEEKMLLVLKIAYFCTLDNPKERPNRKDIRCMLAQIKH
ncbi:hypothetical protein FF2_015013 [Malus domestica]